MCRTQKSIIIEGLRAESRGQSTVHSVVRDFALILRSLPNQTCIASISAVRLFYYTLTSGMVFATITMMG